MNASRLISLSKKYAASASVGLSGATMAFLFGMFATKAELKKVEDANAEQWKVITALKADAAANDAIIRYYFHKP